MKTAKVNTTDSAIVTLGNGNFKYQICTLGKDSNDKPVVTSVELVTADTLKQACEYANEKHGKADCRVYPYCTKEDGESQLRLAEHTLASFEKWERRNNNAVLNPQNRNEWDKEDYIMLACIAINAVLEDKPNATMHELKTMAFKAIANEQKSNERKAEREYNPDFIMCNIAPRTARATIPELDKLFRLAIDKADLTDKQMAIVSYMMDGLSIANIAELMEITKGATQNTLYSAEYKTLCKAVELDKELSTFELMGLTAEDVDNIKIILAKRARVK